MKKVTPYKTTLDAGNAYWMARLSKAVYTKTSNSNQKPDAKNILASLQADDPGFLSVEGYDNKSSQAMLVEHEDYLCMSFRGTNEIGDWLDNINVFATQVLFGKFHRGFWNSVEDIWEPIHTRYSKLRLEKKRPLFITGHSLGGAMATVAVARFVHDDLPFSSVYTFGQPRVLERETARIFNAECKSRYFRFHNNNDIVTRVPARLMGYSHIGSYLYITQEKEIVPEIGFWNRFLDLFDGVISDAKEKGLDMINDHSIDEYLAAIKEWNYDEGK